jgi:malonyl-CoA/methylmalonyl-CoA synthetase
LASFKIPRGFVLVEKLPRTALGKVQKHLLPRWEP